MDKDFQLFCDTAHELLKSRCLEDSISIRLDHIELRSENARCDEEIIKSLTVNGIGENSLVLIDVNLHYGLYDRLRAAIEHSVTSEFSGYNRRKDIESLVYKVSMTRNRIYCFVHPTKHSTVIVVPRLDIGWRLRELRPYMPGFMPWYFSEKELTLDEKDMLIKLMRETHVRTIENAS